MSINKRDSKLVLLGIFFFLLLIGLLLKPFIIKQSSTQSHKKALTVKSSEKTSIANFIPDGAYVLKKPLQCGIYQFDSFLLKTVEDTTEDYKAPKFITPSATVTLVVNAQKQTLNYECPKPTIKMNKILLKSVETPIGLITIEGSFVDKQGHPWTNLMVQDGETMVRGKLTIIKNHQVINTGLVDFIFWGGPSGE